MNILDVQDNLKNLPEQALMQEMQRPTGSAPQFLVLGELKRRKQMRDDYNRQQNSDMKTVAEEVVTAAGAPQEGIMQMSRSLNPNTNMAQDTGLAQATPVTPTQAPQPQAPQMMSGGGIMRMAGGRKLAGGAGIGSVSADVEDFAATPSYKRGTGRATMIDGIFVEVMPDGNVFDARTGEMVTGDLAQAAIAKLTPDLTADNAAFAEAQGMPSVYNPEATMPSQADLDLRAQEAPAPDVFPNDISSFDAAAAYNAEQAQRRAEAARMMGINEIPTQQPTFTGDVLPYLGRVASAVGSQAAGDISTAISGSPEERLMAMPVEAGDPTQAQITMLRRTIDDPEADTTARANAAQQLQELQNRIAVTQTGGNLSATAEDGGISIPEGYVMGPFGVPRVDPNYKSPGKTGNSLIDQAALQGREALTTLAESGAVDPTLANAAKSIAQQSDYERNIYPVNVEIAQLNAATNNPYLPEDLKSGIISQIAALEADKIESARLTGAGSLVAPDVEAAQEIPSETVGGYAGLIAPNVIEQESSLPETTTKQESSLPETTTKQGDANRRAADSMMGTGITSIGGRGAAPKGVATTPVATKDTGDAGFGSMDSRIAQMLSNRQKEAESDKWMALAQTGMALMASKNPTLGGALGEAGLAGIGALQKSKQGALAFETDMLKLQTQLDIAQQRARSSSLKDGRTSATAYAALERAYSDALTAATANPTAPNLTRLQELEDMIGAARSAQFGTVAANNTNSGVIKAPSAQT